MDLESEEIAKAKIKYFRIKQPKIIDSKDEETRMREYDYSPEMIIEFRPGQIEEKLIPPNYYDEISDIFSKNIKYWDYRKPFDFEEWLESQEPITFSEKNMIEISYKSGDRILIGTWIKSKILELFSNRTAPWDNREEITRNCRLLLDLEENYFIKNIKENKKSVSKHSREEIIDYIKEKWLFKGMEDKKIYHILYNLEFFEESKILSGTQELYKVNFDERLYIPCKENETWDIRENRELLLGVMNQAFYELLIRNAKEIQGIEKDYLLEEEFKNRIKILEDISSEPYYQLIDDSIANDRLLELKKLGYNITFDPYNPNHLYPSGNIKYFKYMSNQIMASWEEQKKERENIQEIADKLTIQEARKIFTEDFYHGRAYYQVKEQSKGREIRRSGEYCEANKNNFYPDGSVKYFWVDYQGHMSDFEDRRKILEFADELPREVAIELKKADELAEYQEKERKENEERVKSVIKSSKFSKKYQKAIRDAKEGEVPDKLEFAMNLLEQNQKYIRQKKLSSEKRTRKITIEDMVQEIANITENRFEIKEQISEDLYMRIFTNKINFDDVIELLSDIIITEDEAKCVATIWQILKSIEDADLTEDIITEGKVKNLFPRLYEETDINKKSAKIIAEIYNSQIESLKEKRAEEHDKKVKKIKSMRKQVESIEL